MPKLKRKNLYQFIWALILLVANQEIAFAPVTPNINEVESILDQLEKRLQDQEQEGITSGERNYTLKKNPKNNLDNKLKFEKGQTINPRPNTKEQEKLQELSAAVNALEDDIEKLATDVQATKQRMMETAKIDNFVEINANVQDADKASLKSLNIKIDGYEVYTLEDNAGLWMPSKSLPIYSGPMPPGKHKLDFEARLVLREENSLPLNKNVYRHVAQSFDLDVPDGVVRKKWSIDIEAPKNQNSGSNVSLKQDK